ncbi:lytic murein transglycosylase B [Pistricoccus aurantiacus]|nr:lytic murein transglycosylase B [Pistricoccus aurantiacus]
MLKGKARMLDIARLSLMLLCLAPLSVALGADADAEKNFDPEKQPPVKALVDSLSTQGLSRNWLEAVMKEAHYRQEVLDAMAGAAERNLRWDEYRNIFMKPARILRGAAFIATHKNAFDRAREEYGVPAEFIAAILGVETDYGRVTGKHRVLDSLATLAFHHPQRGGFFRRELAAFLTISHDEEVDPATLKGSYAGAMGYPQFIPTSYQAYAVDFDGDGHRDLWHNPVDAIGSIANYFAVHGWREEEGVVLDAQGPEELPRDVAFNQTKPPYATLASLGEKGIVPAGPEPLAADRQVIPLALDYADDQYRYRLGLNNFYVITRYNHSHLYAMAVCELADAIAQLREKAETLSQPQPGKMQGANS